MGGYPELGPIVHLVGSDLNFQGLAVRSDHGGVKALVEVELGEGDVILEPALNGGPSGMDQTQSPVTVFDQFNQNPDSYQVVDVLERQPAIDHLAVDGVMVLGTAFHNRFDTDLGQHLPGLGHDLADNRLPFRRTQPDKFLYFPVAAWIKYPKAEVLHLVLDFLKAQTMSERGVDLQAFPRLGLLFFRR